jgi:nucleotide-binding universal stress UspA family protein
MMTGPVVVGYDQTPHSERALAEAAREAAMRGTSLDIVHAYFWLPPMDLTASPVTPPAAESEEDCRKAAEQVADEAAERIRSANPGLHVEARAVAGHAAKALADASRGAELLVVGSRGRGGFVGQLLGSVSLRVLADACCPVIVVHGPDRPARGLVVAAVDIDEPCEDVFEFAFIEASRRGATLTVHHVWDEPWILTYGEDTDVTAEVAAVEADCALRLDSQVRSWHARFPEVQVTQRVGTGPTATVLVEASGAADLVVLGGRRHGDGRHGMKLGPVATTVLHHSTCPVAVVPLG